MTQGMVTVAGVAMSMAAAQVLEAVASTVEGREAMVRQDLARLAGGRRGSIDVSEALVEECIDGVEDPATEAAWREYVSALAGALESSRVVVYRGSDRSDVVRQIEEALGADGTRELASQMYERLDGGYTAEARCCWVTATEAEWRAALDA